MTRQEEAVVLGNGQSDLYEENLASFAARVETDYESNMLASAGGVVSLTPNRAALLQGEPRLRALPNWNSPQQLQITIGSMYSETEPS